MSKRKFAEPCAYCGKGNPGTRDHIPPQNLFAPPRPSDLITVPCCEACRRGWSNDDEYFRLAIVSAAAFQGSDAADRANEAVLRSLTKPSKAGFSRFVRASLVHVDVRSEVGIFLGKAPALKLNKRRFDRVAERIIRGLFWHEKRHPVPDQYIVLNRQSNFEPAVKALGAGASLFVEPRHIAGGAFAYTYASSAEDPSSSAWLSMIYGVIPFVGYTVKPKHLR